MDKLTNTMKRFVILPILLTIGIINQANLCLPDFEVKSPEKEATLISKKKFMSMNSKIESNHRWDIVNKHGYMGKYQIGKIQLLELGYDTVWVEEVVNSIQEVEDSTGKISYHLDLAVFTPSKQEEAINKYFSKMEKIYLKKHIKRYVGKTIDGIRITKAGILSASMLGHGKVCKFLESDGKDNRTDRNGQSIKFRLKKFENLELKK